VIQLTLHSFHSAPDAIVEPAIQPLCRCAIVATA
jgi:hypothetical protein